MTINSSVNPFEAGIDELDQWAQGEFVKRHRVDHRVSVLVLPAGNGDSAFQFARMGGVVTVGDVAERKQEIDGRILAAGLRDEVSFAPCALPQLPDELPHEPFDILICRRGLCRLPYDEAKATMRQFLKRLRIGGKLYLSLLGLHSALGEGYEGNNQTIRERMSPLAPGVAAKYGIDWPVCLYSERDVFMLLLESGATVLRTSTTTYGNVHAVGGRV